MATPPRGAFGSKLGFILAAAGSAVGLGNIWRFPYAVGEGGGGAFVLVYLGFIVLIGVPVLLAELSLGRATRSNPVGAFKKICPGSLWPYVGGLGVLTGFGVLAFYSVVAGWTLSYLGRALTGAFSSGFTVEQSGELFGTIIADPVEGLGMTAVFLALTALVVRGGVSGGIERAAKILMPLFVVVLLALATRSLTLPNAGAGLDFLFSPDFSKLSGHSVMFALGQALFSLSLGMGAMITYGSYLPKGIKLPSAGVAVAIADTSIAILAGLIIFPALFSVGAESAKGPGLVFVALPAIFPTMPAGGVFAVAFYFLLAVAALTSTVSLLEVVVAYTLDELGWSRDKAVWTIVTGVFLLAIPSALSQGGTEFFSKFIGDTDFLTLQSILWGNFALTFGALLISIFVGWKWGVKKAREEMPTLPAGELWALSVRVLAPTAILIVLAFVVYHVATTGKDFF